MENKPIPVLGVLILNGPHWLKRQIESVERMSSRIGYMGAGLLVAGQWTLNPFLFIFGFICVMIQTAVRRQWNLVLLQLNGLIAWTIHLINGTTI